MDILIRVIFMAFCVSSISYTICSTGIFKWLRELISPLHSKIEEWIHCPYCFGHFVSLILLLCLWGEFIEISDYVVFNFFFTWFTIMGICGLIHFVLLRAYEPVAKNMAMRRLMKNTNEED